METPKENGLVRFIRCLLFLDPLPPDCEGRYQVADRLWVWAFTVLAVLSTIGFLTAVAKCS